MNAKTVTGFTCPLCAASLLWLERRPNNALVIDEQAGRVIGIATGTPEARAECANGCTIAVRAKRRDSKFLRNPELPAAETVSEPQ